MREESAKEQTGRELFERQIFSDLAFELQGWWMELWSRSGLAKRGNSL